MSRTTYDVQRDFALSYGLRSEIIWDSLSGTEGHILEAKISSLFSNSEVKGEKTLDKQRKQLFKNIWMQRKYTNGVLLSAIIYVLVTNEMDLEVALKSTNFTCHPVFRTRKCMKDDNSEGCCMIFIDEHGRVYASWDNYVLSNTLPKGLMIAPSRGVYTFSDEDSVHLTLLPTPAARVRNKMLRVSDSVATVGGVVSSVPFVAALAIPIGGPLLLAATTVGAVSAVYSTARSVTRLIDRRRHGQSNSVRDPEARSSWLNAATGVVGIGATGATKVVSAIAKRGYQVNKATELALKGAHVSSILISGSGVANGVYDLYIKVSDEQQLSSLDILQIASSLIIFTHSINNLRVASKATNGSSLRNALRNETRKIYDLISRETVKLHGGLTTNKFDIVRILNDIPLKDVLLSLHKINSHLTQGASVIGALSTAFLSNFVTTGADDQLQLNLEVLNGRYGSKFVQHISSSSIFLDVLFSMATYFTEGTMQFLIESAHKFINDKVDNIDRTLNTFISTENILYRMIMHCVINYQNFSIEFLEKRGEELLLSVEKYFKSLQSNGFHNSRKHKCAVCKGTYVIYNL